MKYKKINKYTALVFACNSDSTKFITYRNLVYRKSFLAFADWLLFTYKLVRFHVLFGFGICLFVFCFFLIRFNICFSLLLNQWDCRNICQIKLSTKPFLSMTRNFSHCTLLQLSKYRIGYQCTASVFASQKQMPEYTEWIVCIVFSSRAQWLNPELQTIGTNEPQHTSSLL